MTTETFAFISSKMKELESERQAIYELLPMLGSGLVNMRAWVYEKDALARNNPIRQTYLDALENSILYIGIFWNDYGEWTIDEFDHATRWGIDRHIYVKDVDTSKRDPRLTEFLNKWGGVTSGITAKWFKTTGELVEAMRESVELWARERLGQRQNADGRLIRHPDDLARRPKKFIGREQLRQNIHVRLNDGETVLLQGFGGVGKSALAAEVAAQFVNDKPILWIEASDSPPEILLEAITRAISLDTTRQVVGAAKIDDQIQLVRDLLRNLGVSLLVLDDEWNEHALNAMLRALPKGLPLLVTSRRRYPLDTIFDVDTLLPDEASRLLTLHSGQEYTDTDELCKQLGYLPFALEIAGATLKVNLWTPIELLKRMENPLSDMKTPLTLREERRESVKALLDISLNALYQTDKLAHAIFLAFGAFFAPRLTVEMLKLYFAEKVEVSDEILAQAPNIPAMGSEQMKRILQQIIAINTTAEPLKQALDTLVDYGLATSIASDDEYILSYRIHDIAYGYAAVQTITDQRDAGLYTCLIYAAVCYNEASPKSFRSLRPELHNLMGAVDYALNRQFWQIVEQFTHLWSIHTGEDGFLQYCGFYVEGEKLLLKALTAAREHGNQQAEGNYLASLGTAYSYLGQFDMAIKHYLQSLDIAQKFGDKYAEAVDLGNLGVVYLRLGKYDTSIDYHLRALVIRYKLENPRLVLGTLNELGNIHKSLGKHNRAIEYYLEALKISRHVRDRHTEGMILDNLGNISRNIGNYAEAINLHLEALAIHRSIGYKAGEGSELANLGNVYLNIGQYAKAIEYLVKSLVIAEEIGNRWSAGVSRHNLGNAYLSLEQYDEAFVYFTSSLEIVRKMGDKQGEASTLGSLGTAYHSLGQIDNALDYYGQALAISREIGDKGGESKHLGNLGNAYLQHEQHYKAIDFHNQALAISREISDKEGEGSHLSNLGSVYSSLEQYDKAIDFYQQSRAIFVAIGVPHLIERVDSNIAQTQIKLLVQMYREQGKNAVRDALKEAGIPDEIIDELLPQIKATSGGNEQSDNP
jgi:tetratricopeptide (TPR) repeat protein